jgi:hypothetical protein
VHTDSFYGCFDSKAIALGGSSPTRTLAGNGDREIAPVKFLPASGSRCVSTPRLTKALIALRAVSRCGCEDCNVRSGTLVSICKVTQGQDRCFPGSWLHPKAPGHQVYGCQPRHRNAAPTLADWSSGNERRIQSSIHSSRLRPRASACALKTASFSGGSSSVTVIVEFRFQISALGKAAPYPNLGNRRSAFSRSMARKSAAVSLVAGSSSMVLSIFSIG